jgi:hypothetical protein
VTTLVLLTHAQPVTCVLKTSPTCPSQDLARPVTTVPRAIPSQVAAPEPTPSTAQVESPFVPQFLPVTVILPLTIHHFAALAVTIRMSTMAPALLAQPVTHAQAALTVMSRSTVSSEPTLQSLVSPIACPAQRVSIVTSPTTGQPSAVKVLTLMPVSTDALIALPVCLASVLSNLLLPVAMMVSTVNSVGVCAANVQLDINAQRSIWLHNDVPMDTIPSQVP